MDGYRKSNNQYYLNFKKLKSVFYSKSRGEISEQSYIHWKILEKKKYDFLNLEKFKKFQLKEKLENLYISETSELNKKISIFLKKNKLYNSNNIIFVNGNFFTISHKNNENWYIKIKKDIKLKYPKIPIKSSFFLNLIESFSQKTCIIRLKKNILTNTPLYLFHINYEPLRIKKTNISCYRHIIKIGSNSSAKIFQFYISLGKQDCFVGSHSLILLSKNSKLEHTKITLSNNLSYHISYDDIQLNKKSILKNNIFTNKSKFTYQKINTISLEKDTILNIKSFCNSQNKNFYILKTNINHNKKFSKSYQLHKIIGQNYSTNIFQGLIKIKKKLDHIDAKMYNHNLIFGEHASIKTYPYLKIYSNNIICKHGATIGLIDKNQLFYLRSRGISIKNAKSMIISSFFEEIIDHLDHELIKKFLKKIYK